MKHLIAIFFFFICVFSSWSQAWKTYPFTPEGSLISFPLDEGRHTTEPIEWWYSIGHFTGKDSGTPYSYMLCYFYANQLGFDGFRIFSLSNEQTGEFWTETLPLKYDELSTSSMNIKANVGLFSTVTETWNNEKNAEDKPIPFAYNQHAEASKYAIDFNHETIKKPLIVADSGYLYIGEGAYSYYYSHTKNQLTGTLLLNGTSEEVEGTSWFDRQYGNFNILTDNRYEWFCIQLSNGMEMLAYNVFTNDGQLPDLAENKILAVNLPDGQQFTTYDLNIERLSFKFTDDLELCYSQGWRITSKQNNIDLTCTALNISNEVKTPIRFFEGSMSISGTVNGQSVTGKGFAELIHNYEVPDVNFHHPILTNNDSLQLTWEVLNKDAGNPLYYTLTYTLNNEERLNIIVSDIQDTVYNWQLPALTNNDHLTIYLRASSVDGTLYTDESTELNYISSNSKDVISNKSVKVFPNPANKTLRIEANEFDKLELIKLNGKQVLSVRKNQLHAHQLDVSGLSTGTYILNIFVDENVLSQKVQIVH